MNSDLAQRMRNHDWRRGIRDGFHIARDQVRKDRAVTLPHIAWALLTEAAQVSRIAYAAPPRTGYPVKSAMPESVDEVTQWQLMSAYLRGDITSLPDDEGKAPRPEAHVIDRAGLILDLWHQVALAQKGDKRRLKKAVYDRAQGIKPRVICKKYGITYRQLHSALEHASEDMAQQIEKHAKKMFV